MYGSYMNYVWILCIFCRDYVWFCVDYTLILHGLLINRVQNMHDCAGWPRSVLTQILASTGLNKKIFSALTRGNPTSPSPVGPAPAPSARGTHRARAREFFSTTEVFFAHGCFQNHRFYKRTVPYFERKLVGVFFEHHFSIELRAPALPLLMMAEHLTGRTCQQMSWVS